jgi:hypothetical protein
MRRIHQLFHASVLLLMCVSCTSGPAAAQHAEFQKFLAAWSGDFDNLAQVQAQQRAGKPESEQNLPLRLFIRKVDLPAFGPHAYYGEWRNALDPAIVTRQRIYAFEIDAESGLFRLNLHIWPNDDPEFLARTAGAYQDLTKLAGTTPDDMMELPGCDVFFESGGNGFAGAMQKGTCAFPAPGDGRPIYSWSQMTLTSSQFAYLDGWYNTDGTPHRRFTTEWYVFDRK